MDAFFEKIYNFLGKFIKSEKAMAFIRKVFSREIIMYLVFGVLTTVVNLIVYHFCNLIMDVLISNVIAWIAAVIFAYVTNKLFVFDSKSWAPAIVVKEAASFAAARLVTLGIEEAGLLIMIKWLHFDVLLNTSLVSGKMIVKIILAIVVVILNYVFSKAFIFKKKEKNS
jgi:putative flippase GtrA